ncbi:MAG: PASTA domain-containing protein [Muribaculaceae bacterium]
MQIKAFSKQHPIIFNVVLIFITALLLIALSFLAMNVFTRHGQSQEVPDLKGKPLREAIVIIENQGLKWEINDSVYNDTYQPGCVVEQSPKAFSAVKAQRTIYLTVTPFSPRLVTLPNVKDMSVRTGQSMLEGLGFRNINIEMVHSEFNGLILGITINGRNVASGERILLSSQITLQVGDGAEMVDSIGSDENVKIIDDGGETLTDPSLI